MGQKSDEHKRPYDEHRNKGPSGSVLGSIIGNDHHEDSGDYWYGKINTPALYEWKDVNKALNRRMKAVAVVVVVTVATVGVVLVVNPFGTQFHYERAWHSGDARWGSVL